MKLQNKMKSLGQISYIGEEILVCLYNWTSNTIIVKVLEWYENIIKQFKPHSWHNNEVGHSRLLVPISILGAKLIYQNK